VLSPQNFLTAERSDSAGTSTRLRELVYVSRKIDRAADRLAAAAITIMHTVLNVQCISMDLQVPTLRPSEPESILGLEPLLQQVLEHLTCHGLRFRRRGRPGFDIELDLGLRARTPSSKDHIT